MAAYMVATDSCSPHRRTRCVCRQKQQHSSTAAQQQRSRVRDAAQSLTRARAPMPLPYACACACRRHALAYDMACRPCTDVGLQTDTHGTSVCAQVCGRVGQKTAATCSALRSTSLPSYIILTPCGSYLGGKITPLCSRKRHFLPACMCVRVTTRQSASARARACACARASGRRCRKPTLLAGNQRCSHGKQRCSHVPCEQRPAEHAHMPPCLLNPKPSPRLRHRLLTLCPPLAYTIAY